MFGALIGYGDYGFVFEDETEINGPDGAVVKIMTLDTPGWECNLQQYNMFAQLMNHQDQGVRTPGLPAVFKHFRGQMDLNLLNILSYMGKDTDPYAVRALRESIPVGSEYAVIIMEKLPCVATNQYCGRNLKDSGNIAEEQSVYEQMVKYLYDSGWWVRDVIDPRNVGYNLHGSPVWFDPMVARRRGFPGYSSDAIAMCHEEVDAYPSSYRKAVQDGSYFKERHGYGLFHGETFVSRDYPQCYLCGLPAKIEVLTAVGMRNFCSNKCRGDYEGIDYGPDDYFISPKLEHQLSIVTYSPGIQLDYEKDIEAKVTIQCQNCPLVIKYKFPESHVRRRGDWHKHKDEEGNTMDKEEIGYCDHDMSVIKYISNDWERAGMAAIRCHKCQLADEMSADIPEGCSNLGSQKPKWFGSEPDWEDIDWSEPPKKDDLGDEVEWESEWERLLLRKKIPDTKWPAAGIINFAGF